MSDSPPAWMDEAPPQTGRSVANRGAPGRDVLEMPEVDEDTRTLMTTLRNSLYPGASWGSIAMVLQWCRVNKVDPFLKAVHIVPMNVRLPGRNNYEWRDVLMPGIADYRIKASRSGVYLGKSEPIFGPTAEYDLGGEKLKVPEWCKIIVKKLVHGHVAEFAAIEFWLENYATAGRDTARPNAMWGRRGRGQLAKCAEAAALRMGFPEFGSAPTAEEMEGKPYETIEIVPALTQAATPTTKLEAFEELHGSAAEAPPSEPVSEPAPETREPEAPTAVPANRRERLRTWADQVRQAIDPGLKTVAMVEKYEANALFVKQMAQAREIDARIVEEIEDALQDRKSYLTQVAASEGKGHAGADRP